MPKQTKHNQDEIYQNIMGGGAKPVEQGSTEENTEEKIELPEISDKNTDTTVPALTEIKTNNKQTLKINNGLDELIHKSYYLTKRHVKAIKMRTATSDNPEDKDQSSIIRAALNAYLADELKNL